MTKQTLTGTISGDFTGSIKIEVDVPDGGGGNGNGGGPGPEPTGSWIKDIIANNPMQGLNGPQLTQRAQQGHYNLPESLRGLPERTDLQQQINAGGNEVTLEPGIYRASANITRQMTLKGNQRVSIRASDNWSHGGSAGCTWQGNANNGWTSSLQLPNWTPEPVQPFEVMGQDGAWRASRAWVVMLDGARVYIEPGTGRPTEGHFRIDANRRVILRDNPAGRLIEVTVRGGGAGAWLNIAVAGCTLDGIDFRHAGSGVQRWNALESNGNRTNYINSMFGWTHGYGPLPGGSTDSVIEGNIFHNSGIGGCGAPATQGLRVRNNLFFNNGFGQGWDRHNGSGGCKLISANDILFEGNAAWDNGFSGLWVDIDCQRSNFNNNVTWDNGGNNIHYEISRNGSVEDNVCFRTPNFQAPGFGDMTERTLGVYMSSSTRVRINRNLCMHLPANFEFRAMNRDDQPEGPTAQNVTGEGNTAIGRFRPGDQANQWGADFGLVWVDNGGSAGGAIMNHSSNWFRNARYWWNGPEPENRWAYQEGRDIFVDRIATLQARAQIGQGAAYLQEGEARALLQRFGLSA